MNRWSRLGVAALVLLGAAWTAASGITWLLLLTSDVAHCSPGVGDHVLGDGALVVAPQGSPSAAEICREALAATVGVVGSVPWLALWFGGPVYLAGWFVIVRLVRPRVAPSLPRSPA